MWLHVKVLLCGNYESIITSLLGLNEQSKDGRESRGASDVSQSETKNDERALSSNANRGTANISNCDAVFKLPCKSIFPVNIGGFIAWVVVVERGEGIPIAPTTYRSSARKALLHRLKGRKLNLRT